MTGHAQGATILLVDDNPTNLQVLFQILDGHGHTLLVAKDGEAALRVAAKRRPSLILLDIMMPPGIDGYEVCRRLKADESTRDAAVIFLSALDDTKDKVKGLELGAVDYVTKPFAAPEVLARVDSHLTVHRLQQELREHNAALQHELRVAQDLAEDVEQRLEGALLGESAAIEKLKRRVQEHGSSDRSLLLLGGPGAGEEAVARAVHQQSGRSARPFIRVDGLAVRESGKKELFGSGGGLLGLLRGREPGKWDLADRGTLFFERVDALPKSIQHELAKRLNALKKDHDAQRTPTPDVRVIAQALNTGGVVKELMASFETSSIVIPPLNERQEDLPALVDYFLHEKARRMGRTIKGVSRRSLKRLKAYSWPGNIQELQSVLECAILSSPGETVEIDEALLEAGSRVGSYQLVERLGEGGMGEVWLAKHRLLVRPAAVKLIRATQLADEAGRANAIARFEREARATAALESPNTIRLYDFGVTDDGSFYYVMERLRGLDLDALVKKHGPLPVSRVLQFMIQACGSLAEAHEAGLVHRDIKPANMFACILGLDHDVLKVLDFGMVRTEPDEQDVRLTGAGNIVGTPAYMAPEQALGRSTIGPEADIYALGCVMFSLLSGEYVFDCDSAMGMLTSHAAKPPRVLSEVAEQAIPPELDAVVERCLAKEPAERPASARALRAELLELARSHPWTPADAEGWWRDNGPKDPAP
jgi:eukaryotic-like serine/threonine-protein kinase